LAFGHFANSVVIDREATLPLPLPQQFVKLRRERFK
jgi:hypothetical protein